MGGNAGNYLGAPERGLGYVLAFGLRNGKGGR